MYDIIIIGGGPAGLTAAIYGKRAEKSVLVIEKSTFGGQITYSPCVENIPGFVSLSGNEFAEKHVDQAIQLGAEFEMCEVLQILQEKNDQGDYFVVKTDGGDFEGKSVIIATGAKHRLLGVPGEAELIGNGVSFCAVCDGAFYKDQVVGIVGGGNSALQEAVLLSNLVKKLHIFQDLPMLTGEKKLQEELEKKENVEIHVSVKVDELISENNELKEVKVTDQVTGTSKNYSVSGLFVAIGLVPQNENFKEMIQLNDYGYADSDENCLTKTPGIFVAGDCRFKEIRQVTTATADGAVAAMAACNYLER